MNLWFTSLWSGVVIVLALLLFIYPAAITCMSSWIPD